MQGGESGCTAAAAAAADVGDAGSACVFGWVWRRMKLGVENATEIEFLGFQAVLSPIVRSGQVRWPGPVAPAPPRARRVFATAKAASMWRVPIGSRPEATHHFQCFQTLSAFFPVRGRIIALPAFVVSGGCVFNCAFRPLTDRQRKLKTDEFIDSIDTDAIRQV